MGMAASQARYLALTARKTNTEWEGQQINQARTALANQSANLFNQLLNLEVPNAPKTTDYTELQYSFTDGENESVLSSWEQLSTSDPNYNYIVKHYYYADVYTGSKKLLENPQVQTKGELTIEDFMDQDPVVTYNANDNTYTITTADGQSRTYSAISDQNMDTKLENALTDLSTAIDMAQADGVLNTDGVYGYQDSNGTWHFFLEDDVAEPKDYSTVYVPSFVGNSKLTELTELTEDQAAELAQVLRDCADSSISDYLSFDEDGNLVYNGEGIYTFDMQGKTYFTTEKDLYNSMQTQNDYEKPIDVQEKLAYYNATYVQKKIEETNHALLETDGNGRFTSVKFDDDSVVYSLNVESVTDEDAYQDAMNEYRHAVEVYEKTINDINALTSTIQKEDQQLELKLEQLDTEQAAISTEMESVKKVIDDSVEKIFNTFQS